MEFDSKRVWVTMLGSSECLAADDVTIRCVSAELVVEVIGSVFRLSRPLYAG